MIINHRYKFIFLKTRKTAGTSIEIALSQFSGPQDVITPISDEDEATRAELGFKGPQNFLVPFRYYRKMDWVDFIRRRERLPHSNHDCAGFIRRTIPKDVWDSYFKFCFERNPFDKAVSAYYWSTREPRPEINGFLEAAPVGLLSNWNTYTINDQVVADFVGRYENLEDDLGEVSARLALPKALSLPWAKSGYRSDRRHFSEVLNSKGRARIEITCAKEIAHFGYSWQAPEERA
jgi:hypothetical protein